MGKTSNLIVSGIVGFLFAVAWWIFIDAAAFHDHAGEGAGNFVFYLPGILATVGLFLLNNLPNPLFESGDAWGAEETPVWQKILIVISIMLHLAGLIMTIWVFAHWNKKGYLDTNYPGFKPTKVKQYLGIASIVQTILIIISSLLWRFAWISEENY
ncbi:putative membrane protein [Trichomonas vaginalis G3]|uniref:Putative membrane protein n=1 Tax=Trichomonas vaginalis (strain ATCC PRA-98 / G3) TaxID=412133 RepID=A2DCX4_TRIV3|nr:SMALL membrane protein-related family [Trichomonas vaginalis G3]EAY21748.1 putative membrane protein [Trichomonas vaginalis G3]KAI5524277.1 SMALL membrane protein-related family [Trichomonas vaginalis G3]|eukprot:XP_001582734.1 membrane protein [Trichomonas vaginalis G3]